MSSMERNDLDQEVQRRLADQLAAKPVTMVVTPDMLHRFERAERRLVRVEARLTNALRRLGLHPGHEPGPAPAGRAIVDSEGNVVVTGPDVTVGEIAEVAVLAGGHGERKILFHNQVWGTVTVAQPQQYEHTPETCPICKGKPLAPLRIGRHTCNLCGNASA